MGEERGNSTISDNQARKATDVLDIGARLLASHVAGDASAFGELLSLYRKPVYSYLSRMGVSAAVKDDLFQDIFLKIHLAASSFDSSRKLNPWLYTIVLNCVRSHFRKYLPRFLSFEEKIHLHGKNNETSLSDSVYDLVEAKELKVWLEQAISLLPEKQREVLVLTLSSGMSQEEISAILGVPVNTVKTRLRRARTELASGLARRKRIERRENS